MSRLDLSFAVVQFLWAKILTTLVLTRTIIYGGFVFLSPIGQRVSQKLNKRQENGMPFQILDNRERLLKLISLIVLTIDWYLLCMLDIFLVLNKTRRD